MTLCVSFFVSNVCALLRWNPGCYGGRSSISMLGVPMVGTHSWKHSKQETVTLVGSMTLKESLQIRNNRFKYPCYNIRDTQSLKDKQMHDNVQLPSSKGTMTRTLTLQVTRNRQHDTSRPSVQPNHQDYVSSLPPI